MWSANRQHPDDWLNFIEDFRAYERKTCLKDKEDALLDLYSQWLKTKDENLKSKIKNLADEIKRLDPHLHFEDLLRR